MLPTPYQQFIATSRYARFRDEDGRRETWDETVQRWHDFWVDQLVNRFNWNFHEASRFMEPLYVAVYNLDVMPSMRSLMTAGEALKRDNTAGFNCAYLEIDDIAAFGEVMYILMCGTGVGFSVERQAINRLPTMAEELHATDTTIIVADSKIGWAASLKQLITLLYGGQIPKWDTSKVRKKGERLKTFGGRASGPEPLVRLFEFVIKTFVNAHADWKAGNRELPKLTSVEIHDIVCMIGDVVVVGGVRRSAEISLSNLSDDRMRNAKNGDWRRLHGYRELANNSAVYTEKPQFEVFMKEMVTLFESYSGERGIFSRVAAKRKAAENGRRDPNHDFGTNPCGEIILRSKQFCNLSEAVLRAEDDYESIRRKVEIASIIGTLQSTLTDFRFLRSAWKKNSEEERLLGVSLTGIMDCVFLRDSLAGHHLRELRDVAINTNAELADRLGIQRSAAITTVKPSGTVSQLVNSASGIHPRYSQFYIRSVRQDNKDPVTQFLIAAGVPYEPAIGKEDSTTVFYFPMKAPPGPDRNTMGALEQLRLYAMVRENWCEHNPSTTIYYTNDNFFAVMQWVWENFDRVGGVSFLPHDGGVYKQAPYTEIDEATYERRLAEMPEIDWEMLKLYETEDGTNPQGERACMGGACEL